MNPPAALDPRLPPSLIVFLISADALWQHGFGVIFPELDGCRSSSGWRHGS